MRITNPMMTNRMLLNMTRNAINVDTLYNQIATGKKISFPSDNPILASRALKFRTNVSETTQYMKNVAQGLSWMEVSEAAFKNIHSIMDKIRDLAERGSSGTLTFEDRQKIITEIASLTDQIGLEMNATYAGRYIFSGYRTDEPPTITENDPNMKYRITQYFTPEDIEHARAYTQILPDVSATPPVPPGMSTVKDVQLIKLAYSIRDGQPDLVFIDPPIAPANIVSINDADAYTAGNFIRETGEYVISDGTNSVPLPTSFTYEKTGFLKGEFNPKIYFNSMDLSNIDLSGVVLDGTDVITSAALINGNYTADDLNRLGFTDAEIWAALLLGDPDHLAAVNTEYGLAMTGAGDIGDLLALTPSPTLREINGVYASAAPPLSTISPGDLDAALARLASLSPVTTADLTDPAQLAALGIKRYNAGFEPPNIKRQELELEFSIGTRVKINSHAADIFSDKLYGDLQALVQSIIYVNALTKDQIRTRLEMAGNLSGEELEDHLALETQKIQDAIQSRLKDMIGLADMHMNRISREHTDMGTRMSRLELIESRLSDDRVSYTKLLSENEDVDYMDAMMNLNIAESVYQASLHAGANIMKITLADYI